MPCYYPMRGERSSTGVRIIGSYRHGEKAGWISLPCGRCIGCRLEHSRQWATRIMFESQLHDSSAFITLTYNDENLPFPPSLNYKHFQDFMKRLRKRFGKVRFYMCGEYGDINLRPHYHAALFGVDFAGDRQLYRVTDSGHNIYISDDLASLWPFGFSSVCELNFDTAAYISRYVTKKITGDAAKAHYSFTDAETGEVYDRVPEFAHMSLKPGIGGEWFEKFNKDVYDGHDYVVIRGHKCKPPRYFDKLLKRANPDRFDQVKVSRETRGLSNYKDNIPDRLYVKETIARAGLNRLKPRGDL